SVSGIMDRGEHRGRFRCRAPAGAGTGTGIARCRRVVPAERGTAGARGEREDGAGRRAGRRGPGRRALVETATGLPVLLFTAALVVAGCFWLLVALGLTTARAFDADADVRAWGMGGAPVAVVLSLLTLIAWLLAMGAAVLLAAFGPAGSAT